LATVYTQVAEALGWKWSHAHGGFINERYRDNPGHENENSWQSYWVCECAEDACDRDDIATEEQAANFLRDRAQFH
jgi:hypothetical protein